MLNGHQLYTQQNWLLHCIIAPLPHALFLSAKQCIIKSAVLCQYISNKSKIKCKKKLLIIPNTKERDEITWGGWHEIKKTKSLFVKMFHRFRVTLKSNCSQRKIQQFILYFIYFQLWFNNVIPIHNCYRISIFHSATK